ncbi:hypothetical protein GIY62_06545 [Burkholderia plantarii]|uniref:hypothetical protein n=1 Tax=Burkholderia plantarii TaxID=41899 RepID=UPI00272D9F84|nr:hypothetical protein [Burkholderia plantarii]WLE60309.1 hypothetical protein GIY62_06545 [Burkholderia plantarii]
MTIGDVAALIQAVGSIAAIIVAFWIGSAQGRLAVQMRQADRAERLDAIATILHMTHERAASLQAVILRLDAYHGVKHPEVHLVNRLRLAMSAIDEISVGELSSAAVAEALIEAKTANIRVVGCLPPPNGPNAGAYYETADGEIAAYVTALDAARKQVRREVRRLMAQLPRS